MRIAVTGYRGRLGSELIKNGCLPINARIEDTIGLRRSIDSVKPDAIIHCAAMTNVDVCEQYPKEAMKANFFGTINLASVFAGKIIYISTDYIFDGQDGSYDEYDLPNPINVYGMSKLAGELIVKKLQNSLIIRTTVLFDNWSSNFVTNVAEILRTGDEIQLPDKLFGSPTYVPYLAEGILSAVDYTGVINIAGNRVMSRYEMGLEIVKGLGMSEWKVQPGPIKGAALRPVNAGLNTRKAKMLNIPIYNPLDGIREVISGLEAMAA